MCFHQGLQPLGPGGRCEQNLSPHPSLYDNGLRTWIEKTKCPSISANRLVCYFYHNERNIASHSGVAKPPQRSEAMNYRGEPSGKSEWPDGTGRDGKDKGP